MLLQILFLIVIVLASYYFLFKKKVKIPEGCKEVPKVKGAYPIVGHCLSFGQDPLGFIQKCYKEYGKIFRIKIFLNDMIVVCDRELCMPFFKAKEEDMSLYKVLDTLFFGRAFSDKPNSLEFIIKMVKKTITLKMDEFGPIILDEASRFTKIMKEQKNNIGKKVDMIPEMIKFISRTSCRCFIGVSITDDFYEELRKFTNALNKIVVLTYFFPQWFLNLTVNKFYLRNIRMKMARMLDPEIDTYRTDPLKKDSLLFRTCVDYIDGKTGYKLTNQDINDIVICLLYVSSENTSLLATNALIDLSRNPLYWDLVKNESNKFLKNNDYKALFKSEIIHSCLMETARTTSHIFALARTPQKKDMMLGDYFVSGVNTISLCEPVLMKLNGTADDVFENSEKYDPTRYFEPRCEPDDTKHVMSWSSGYHQCPGRLFSQYENKAAMALLTTTFEKFEINEKEMTVNMFSPSAMSEIHVPVVFKPLKETIYEINYKGKDLTIQNIDNKGWLIKNFLTEEDQKNLYKYTIELSKDSKEQKEIGSIPLEKPHPITYYKLVYTGESNCEKPALWFDFANEIWELMSRNSSLLNFDIEAEYEFDSLYCQLYGKNGFMKSHKDEFVSYGISISLGSSCSFEFGDKTLILESGDIFIADFSKTFHAVKSIVEFTKPKWFSEENEIITFGRSRMSIQIRSVKNCNVQQISMSNFISKINA